MKTPSQPADRMPPLASAPFPALLSIVCLLALAACAPLPAPAGRLEGDEVRKLEREPWTDPDVVLATVNGQPITRGDFYRRALELLGTNQFLASLINEELFRQEAERSGIAVSSVEAEKRADEAIESMARDMGGRERLAALYEGTGKPLEELHRDLVGKARSELQAMKVIAAMRRVDDEALREYYQQTYRNKRYLTRQIVYSFFPHPSRPASSPESLKREALERARRAVQQLRGGADFEALARAESDDPTARDGGPRVAPVSEATTYIPAPVKEAIFALGPGEISDPVESPHLAYHVFQVTEIIPAESFLECVEKMKREIAEREPEPQEIQMALKMLHERADIRWNPRGRRPAPSPGAVKRSATP
jgi:parvulin-like peptidyl-prolyl isomerase